MKEMIIRSQEEGQRLDRYLLKYMPGMSSSFLYKMLRKKNIKCNQAKASGKEKLQAGDRIQIYFSDETLEKFRQDPKKRKDSPRDSIGRDTFKENPEDRGAKARAFRDRDPDTRLPKNNKTVKKTRENQALRRQVRILYQDQDILIVHKPAGMLSQKSRPEDDSLNDWLIDYWQQEIMGGTDLPSSFRPSVANRLDRNTSGIVLCGITIRGLQILSGLLKNRQLDKYYLCIVRGEVREDRVIRGYLYKDEEKNQVRLCQKKTEGSQYIETHYQPLESGREASLLKVKLITGKSHQIRAHLASEGHPILGDRKYGSDNDHHPTLGGRKYESDSNQKIPAVRGVRHQLLHSYELVLPTGIEDLPERLWGLHIIDEVPEDFRRIMRKFQWQHGSPEA